VHDYDQRVLDTLRFLSGDPTIEVPRQPVAEGLSASEIARMTTLSGTHEVRRSTRGSWEPNRTRIDWGAAALPRGPDGRFLSIVHEYNDEWQ
jgi:hypothetical protein